MIMENLTEFCIHRTETIKNALKKMDKSGEGILYVVQLKDGKNYLEGVITDGDLRRAIINGAEITETVEKYYNRNPIKGDSSKESDKSTRECLSNKLIPGIPKVDDDNNLIGHTLRSSLIQNNFEVRSNKIDLPVVIMAGGKGTRLDPFTRILPKPLIPIGERAAIEVIADNFKSIGVNDFYISVNYKKEMVISYFDNIPTNYNIHYLKEDEFYGTAGCLTLLPKNIGKSFIVSNCDIFVHTDYEEIVSFHKENNNMLTIVGSFQHHTIPYGVLDYEPGGRLKKIIEKPEYDFVVNTGVYILEYEALKYIPEGKAFSMVDLIDELRKKDMGVGVFPVSEKSYMDIGQWEEYRSNSENIIKRT